ncbi:hypothetical protein JIN78_14275 [Roseibacillus ishigakijimensis]|uniref:Uncharacterized protein n=1 Tax=Roseibacillus ishigakijimensis TaxID=454146 RepID=A0A934VIM6_9BACT|nr:hypothetical protein [Roseibacillus ishigakijimensis]
MVDGFFGIRTPVLGKKKERLVCLPVFLSGHAGDVVHLKIGGNLDIPNLEWRLKSGDATIGVFTNETTTDAEFKALKPAKDEIELVIDGDVAWSAPVHTTRQKSST